MTLKGLRRMAEDAARHHSYAMRTARELARLLPEIGRAVVERERLEGES